MMQNIFSMILAGITLYGINFTFGASINRYATNYLGQQRGYYAYIAFYLAGYYYLWNRLSRIEHNDINYLINPREVSGEAFVNICLHLFPAKVNLDLYRQIMFERQSIQMLRVNHSLGQQSQPLRVLPIDAQGNALQGSPPLQPNY